MYYRPQINFYSSLIQFLISKVKSSHLLSNSWHFSHFHSVLFWELIIFSIVKHLKTVPALHATVNRSLEKMQYLDGPFFTVSHTSMLDNIFILLLIVILVVCILFL